MEKKAAVGTIGEYIGQFPGDIQKILEGLRNAVRGEAPAASERMSWQMPTFYLNGNLVHFAAHRKHVGFYPGESGIRNFQAVFDELGYKYSKGAVQFPIDKPIPLDLVREIVKFRVSENTRAKAPKK